MLLSDVCLSDVCLSVCLSRTSGLTREQRGHRKTKIGTDVAHVTRDSDTTFEVKGQGHQAALVVWLVVLAGQHGHTVMVTYPYACMTYIVSPFAGLGGGISWRPPAYSLFDIERPNLARNPSGTGTGGHARTQALPNFKDPNVGYTNRVGNTENEFCEATTLGGW